MLEPEPQPEAEDPIVLARDTITRVLADSDGRFTALIGAARLHPGRDLRGLDLGAISIGPEEDIAGYDFSGCCLHGALLCGVDLRKARFAHADLSGADLRGARYTKAQMKTARLDACQVGDWPERPKPARVAVRLDAVAEAVQAALRAAGDDVSALEAEANAHHDEGRYAIAEALWAISTDWRAERDGAEDWETLRNRHNLALAILEQGREDEAVAALRALLPIEERVQGAEHPDVLVTRYRLAQAVLDQGRVDEAEAMLIAVAGSSGFVAMLPHRHSDFALQRARAADALGRIDDGAAFLAEAEAHMAEIPNQNQYVWRAINAYRAARIGLVTEPERDTL